MVIAKPSCLFDRSLLVVRDIEGISGYPDPKAK